MGVELSKGVEEREWFTCTCLSRDKEEEEDDSQQHRYHGGSGAFRRVCLERFSGEKMIMIGSKLVGGSGGWWLLAGEVGGG